MVLNTYSSISFIKTNSYDSEALRDNLVTVKLKARPTATPNGKKSPATRCLIEHAA